MVFVPVSVGIIMIEYGLIPTVQTGFYCDDPKISYKFRGDTISITTLLTFTILVPFIGVS
jgi:phosphatidate phosphatase